MLNDILKEQLKINESVLTVREAQAARQITDDVARDIIAKVGRFPEQIAAVSSTTTDAEPLTFVFQLVQTLQKAGWHAGLGSAQAFYRRTRLGRSD